MSIIAQAALEALLGAGVFILGTLTLTLAIECVRDAHRAIRRNRD